MLLASAITPSFDWEVSPNVIYMSPNYFPVFAKISSTCVIADGSCLIFQASRQKHQAGAVVEAAGSGLSVPAAGPSSGPGAVSSDGRQTASGPATSTAAGAAAEKRYIVPGRRFTEDQGTAAGRRVGVRGEAQKGGLGTRDCFGAVLA